MVGSYLQEVPIYSAVKVNGKKLYEYARKGINVELPKRMVDIKSIELVGDITYDSTVNFSIKCLVSKGTYIRSLVRDIAAKLGTIGVMSSLERTKQGKFSIEDAYLLSDIEKGNYKLIDIGTYFSDMYKVVVDDDLKKDILNGKLLDNTYKYDKILFVDKNNNALAVYSVYQKDINKIKPYKMIGE
jgi:tRNA pseudouridine55 synthase